MTTRERVHRLKSTSTCKDKDVFCAPLDFDCCPGFACDTYTKKCDSMGHCFVAKCRHTEFDDSRRRYCTIYKNLSLPG